MSGETVSSQTKRCSKGHSYTVEQHSPEDSIRVEYCPFCGITVY